MLFAKLFLMWLNLMNGRGFDESFGFLQCQEIALLVGGNKIVGIETFNTMTVCLKLFVTMGAAARAENEMGSGHITSFRVGSP